MPMRLPSYPSRRRRFTRKSAASKIQRSFRSYRSRKPTAIRRVVRNMEPFKYVVSSINTSPSTTWVFMYNLSNITWSKGGGPNRRSSTKCQLKGLQMNIRVAVADATNTIKLALIRGRRSGALNSSSIAFDPNVAGDDLHLAFNQRFVQCIWSKLINVQSTAAGSVYPPYRSIEKYFNLSTICKYEQAPDDNDYTAQPYNNTALYLIAVSDSSLSSHPRISGQCRLAFKDLD